MVVQSFAHSHYGWKVFFVQGDKSLEFFLKSRYFDVIRGVAQPGSAPAWCRMSGVQIPPPELAPSSTG